MDTLEDIEAVRQYETQERSMLAILKRDMSDEIETDQHETVLEQKEQRNTFRVSPGAIASVSQMDATELTRQKTIEHTSCETTEFFRQYDKEEYNQAEALCRETTTKQ
jgi:hypothetical protein